MRTREKIDEPLGWLLDLHVYILLLLYVASTAAAVVFGAQVSSSESILIWSAGFAGFFGCIVIQFGWPLAVTMRLAANGGKVDKGAKDLSIVCIMSLILIVALNTSSFADLTAKSIVLQFIEQIVTVWLVFCIVYVPWTAARLMVSAELQRPAGMAETFKTFLMFFYIVFFVFYLKKRLNRILG